MVIRIGSVLEVRKEWWSRRLQEKQKMNGAAKIVPLRRFGFEVAIAINSLSQMQIKFHFDPQNEYFFFPIRPLHSTRERKGRTRGIVHHEGGCVRPKQMPLQRVLKQTS